MADPTRYQQRGELRDDTHELWTQSSYRTMSVTDTDDTGYVAWDRALRWDDAGEQLVDDRKRERREQKTQNARRARVRDRSMRHGAGRGFGFEQR